MLTMSSLPGRNLRAHPVRTGSLLLFAMLMAVATFGGELLVQSLRQGLETVESRLGADILVTPAEAAREFDAQKFLIEAEPAYFYMDAAVRDEVVRVEGVAAASPQLFLASARSSCCSGRYQVIAFDPKTDFVIRPWIADEGAPMIGAMEVVVGANVAVAEGEEFRIYGQRLKVVGRFASTGSTLDNAVYTDFDTARVLTASSVDKGLNKYGEVDPEQVISSVMVDVEEGQDIEEVADRIRRSTPGVSVATAKDMVKGVESTLASTSRAIGAFVVLVWVIALVMTLLLFSAMINERSREFALLKTLGADRAAVSRVVVTEAVLIGLLGAAAGICLSGGVIAAFRALLGQSFGAALVLPSAPLVAVWILVCLVSVLVAALASALLAIRRIARADSGLVLKEGE